MTLDDYKVLLYRDHPSGGAEVPSVDGCFALMPKKAEALSELEKVFGLIEAECRDTGAPLPLEKTEIVHAGRSVQ